MLDGSSIDKCRHGWEGWERGTNGMIVSCSWFEVGVGDGRDGARGEESWFGVRLGSVGSRR